MTDSELERAPFHLLVPAERARLRSAVERVEHAAGARILPTPHEPGDAWLLLEGHVRHEDDSGPGADYGPGDLLGVREVLCGATRGSWMAQDAVAALRIPASELRPLLAENPAFAAAVFADIARRLAAPTEERDRRESTSLMMSPVREAYLRKPMFVDGATDLVTVCRLLSERGASDVLVRDGDRIGIFTTTDLRDALLQPEPVDRQAVRERARFEPISVSSDTEILEALLLMLRHRVHRVVVREGNEIVGVLGQLDLMSFVSNRSHLIALQIEQAANVVGLREAAMQTDALIEVLQGDGVRVEVICGLVRELNRHLFARLWSLLASPELRENSCLVVMGSEGRGEQIVKTDQDNALLLRDGYAYDEGALADVTSAFSSALREFGYPPCPGGIMLSTPTWCQPVAGFREHLREWIHGPDPEGLMNLAIFLDASAVAGDAGLLAQARSYVDRVVTDSDAFHARFAGAVDLFDTNVGWWSRLTSLRGRDDGDIDLKKAGIFPIVHGARTLALQYRVRALGTAARMRELVAIGRVDDALARDVIDALHLLIGLKLRSNLEQRRVGQEPDNRLQPDSLGTIERDSLKDALAIVRRFRQWLHRHYRMESL